MNYVKKIISIFVLAGLSVGLFAATSSFTQGRWTIRMNDDFTEITICGISNVEYQEDITIPDNFDGVPVTAIGESAFKYARFASISIPSSVNSIGNYAFYDCDYISSVTIPDSVKKMGCSVFASCGKLQKVVLSKGCTVIPESLFSDCYNLTSVTIPSTVTEIKRNAFENCRALKNLELPSSLRTIERQVFNGCTILENLEIPSNVVSVGTNIFSGCTAITLSYKIQIAKKFNVDVF